MAHYEHPPVGEKLRWDVLRRDDFTCRYCGTRPKRLQIPAHKWWRAQATLHVDHVWPRSKGGTNDLNNLVTACVSCNLEKRDKIWTPMSLHCRGCGSVERLPDHDRVVVVEWGPSFFCEACYRDQQQLWKRRAELDNPCEPIYTDLEIEERYYDDLIASGWDVR